jgi:hypothetical protein
MHELPARRSQLSELPSFGAVIGRMKAWFQGNF